MKLKIKKIKTKKMYNYVGKVYDLEIENDHTYNINNILVHNSDYIMLGSMMNKCLESCADTFGCNKKHDNFTEPGEQVDQYDEKTKMLFNYGNRFFKKFRGMSTKAVQKSLGNKEIKTSEGITKMNPVEYTVDGWVENFDHYLRSALSYTNNKDIKQFIGETEFIFISQNAFKRFNK